MAREGRIIDAVLEDGEAPRIGIGTEAGERARRERSRSSSSASWLPCWSVDLMPSSLCSE